MAESNQMQQIICRTFQQRIFNCLSILDTLLLQDEPIVSSFVATGKIVKENQTTRVDAVANILGLRDIKNVSPHQTLPELGMDSIMAIEINQLLETEYEIVLTMQQLRAMTFDRIQKLETKKISKLIKC